MIWHVLKQDYPIWSDFTLSIASDITLQTSTEYHLTGFNGSGKSSFLKKVLIPQLSISPESQYIVYVEQQVQSQYDAVKANALLQQPSVRIDSFNAMVDYLISNLALCYKKQPRPCILIFDECDCVNTVPDKLAKKGIDDYCLIYVSHLDNNQLTHFSSVTIEFSPQTCSFSVVKPK